MTTASGRVVWVGRGISILAALPFVLSGVMKLVAGQAVTEGMAHLGLPGTLILPLAVLELSCIVVYLIPRTAVLGAILMTGFLGGAICTHLRVGEPFYAQTLIGVLLWLGLYLREDRLRGLIPLRRS